MGANTSIRGDRPCLFVSDLFLDIIVNAGMEKANVLPEVGFCSLGYCYMMYIIVIRGLALNTLRIGGYKFQFANSVQDTFF